MCWVRSESRSTHANLLSCGSRTPFGRTHCGNVPFASIASQRRLGAGQPASVAEAGGELSFVVHQGRRTSLVVQDDVPIAETDRAGVLQRAQFRIDALA